MAKRRALSGLWAAVLAVSAGRAWSQSGGNGSETICVQQGRTKVCEAIQDDKVVEASFEGPPMQQGVNGTIYVPSPLRIPAEYLQQMYVDLQDFGVPDMDARGNIPELLPRAGLSGSIRKMREIRLGDHMQDLRLVAISYRSLTCYSYPDRALCGLMLEGKVVGIWDIPEGSKRLFLQERIADPFQPELLLNGLSASSGSPWKFVPSSFFEKQGYRLETSNGYIVIAGPGTTIPLVDTNKVETLIQDIKSREVAASKKRLGEFLKEFGKSPTFPKK